MQGKTVKLPLLLPLLFKGKTHSSIIRIFRLLNQDESLLPSSRQAYPCPARAVKNRIYAAFVQRIGILTHLCHQPGQVRRTAIAQNILRPFLPPYKLIRKLFGPAQHIFIKKTLSVHTDSSQVNIQQHTFQHIRIFRLLFQTEHTPRPINTADGRAGFVIGRDIGKLILVAIGLMNQLVAEKVPIRGSAVIKRAASACYIQLLCHQAAPHLMQHLHKLRILFLKTQIRYTCIQIIGAYRMPDNLIMSLQHKAILVVVHSFLYRIPQHHCFL